MCKVKHGAFQAEAMAGAKALWQDHVWVFRQQQEELAQREEGKTQNQNGPVGCIFRFSFILKALGSHWDFQLRKGEIFCSQNPTLVSASVCTLLSTWTPGPSKQNQSCSQPGWEENSKTPHPFIPVWQSVAHG